MKNIAHEDRLFTLNLNHIAPKPAFTVNEMHDMPKTIYIVWLLLCIAIIGWLHVHEEWWTPDSIAAWGLGRIPDGMDTAAFIYWSWLH